MNMNLTDFIFDKIIYDKDHFRRVENLWNAFPAGKRPERLDKLEVQIWRIVLENELLKQRIVEFVLGGLDLDQFNRRFIEQHISPTTDDAWQQELKDDGE